MSLGTAEIVAKLGVHHRAQIDLCYKLEEIADTLTSGFDPQKCLSVCRAIFPTVKRAHAFEEEVLFPLLQQLASPDTELESSLERLRYEHWEDESFAEELTESLREYAATGSSTGAEKLGYMLRGFFEGLRRHIAFETEHLLPMLPGIGDG